jgi:sugar phosphate isomerase/epimerase
MKIGVNVWYGHGPLSKSLKKAKEVGFDYVEISLDYPWNVKMNKNEVKALKMAKNYNLDLAFHSPWAGIHIAHPINEISLASVKVVENCLRFVSNFAPIYFNFHPGTMEALIRNIRLQRRYPNIMKIAERKLREVVLYFKKLSKNLGIKLVVENSPRIFYLPEHFVFLRKLKNVELCFDIAHAIKSMEFEEVRKDPKKILKKWFKTFKGKISVIHLHDVKIEKEKILDHLLLGLGDLDLEFVFNMVRKSNCRYLLLECYRDLDRRRVSISEMKESLELCKHFKNKK